MVEPPPVVAVPLQDAPVPNEPELPLERRTGEAC